VFELHDKVKVINGAPEIWTVEQIMESPVQYLIELGGEFATRQWKAESELKLVEKAKKTDGNTGRFYPAEPIM